MANTGKYFEMVERQMQSDGDSTPKSRAHHASRHRGPLNRRDPPEHARLSWPPSTAARKSSMDVIGHLSSCSRLISVPKKWSESCAANQPPARSPRNDHSS